MKDIPLTEARARLGELVDQVRYGGEGIGITKGGKPAAAVMPYWYVERMRRQRNELVEILREIREQNRELGLSEDELNKLINEAIHEERALATESAIAARAQPRQQAP